MKKLAVLLGLVVLALPMKGAQNLHIRDVFKVMPDTLAPYLSENNRLDMLDFMDSKMKAVVTNGLGDQTQLESLSDTYLRLSFGEGFQTEMRLLPAATGDTVVCVVSTYGERTQESTVAFFTTRWQPLPYSIQLSDYASSMLVKPDTINAELYDRMVEKYQDNIFVCASLSEKDNTLSLYTCIPLVTTDDKKAISAMQKEKVLIWNGKIFK